MSTSRRFARCLALALALALAACGGSDDDSASDATIELSADVELLPGFALDTGLQPADSPVQASFALKASGQGTVHESAVAASASALYGVPETGKVTIDGSFTLEGALHVDLSGLPSYDGPIPGLENLTIDFSGSEAFDPFSIDEDVVVAAPIPPATLPEIPLPGGVPGKLVIRIGEGSFAQLTFRGRCAGTDGSLAKTEGTIDRGGALILNPSIEVDVPVVGTKSFDIPAITVDLGAMPASDVAAEAAVRALGAAPRGAVESKLACDPVGGAGGGSPDGAGGAPSSTSDGGGQPSTSCTNDAACGADALCDEGACKPYFELCMNDAITVKVTALTAGDREFANNGPSVWVVVAATLVNDDHLVVQVGVGMSETSGDYSEGSGYEYEELPVSATAIYSGYAEAFYVDSDEAIDEVPVSVNDGIVQAVQCVGQTPGDDVCNGDSSDCSYCVVHLGCVRLGK